MRLTIKRNGKNVIPLLMAVCGINPPYWRIDRPDDLHGFLSGDAADKLAAYEDAEEQGLLVRLPCKAGDMVYYRRGSYVIGDIVREIVLDEFGNHIILDDQHKEFSFEDFGKTAFTSRKEAEVVLKNSIEKEN